MEDYLNHYKGKVVLITGGCGAIGSNLTEAVAGLGAKTVIVLDNLSSAEKWNLPSLPNVMFVEGDIRDELKLKRAFFERPDLVLHLAAFFANQNSVDHPETDLDVNGNGTLMLLEYSLLAGLKRFVYASSGCSIYGSSAHNIFLQQGVTCGIPGLVGVMALAFLIFQQLIVTIRNKCCRVSKDLTVSFAASMVVFWVTWTIGGGHFEIEYSPEQAYWFWLLVGLIAASKNINKPEKQYAYR